MVRRLLVVALVVVPLLAAGCQGPSARHDAVDWQPIPGAELAQSSTSPVVETVAAGPGGGWLLGGVVIGPGSSRQVAIWSSGQMSGPWTQNQMDAIPGRDGPNETIFGIAGDAGRLVAFGYRRSPTEGYPRPSTWLAGTGGSHTWQEILEDREFFGGPDIIGFGTLTAGPHGYTIAGTWTDPDGRPTFAVWRSPDGTTWTRNSTAIAVNDSSGLVPLPSGEADSAHGILVAGTVEAPTHANPGRQEGALWYSPDGQEWSRIALRQPDAGSAFGAVTAVSAGWLVAGTEAGRPVVWLVDQSLHVTTAFRLPGKGLIGAKPVAMTDDDGTVIVVAAAGDGVRIWRGHSGSGPGPGSSSGGAAGWTEAAAPPTGSFPVGSASISVGPMGAVLVATGSDVSSEWWTSGLRS